ncbi:hypothetical protein Ocin01_05824, partial [Orchesella cincta]
HMATTAKSNAFVTFTKVAGVLFLLGLRFNGINGKLTSELLNLNGSEPTSDTPTDFTTDETIIPTTEDTIETSSIKEDATITLSLWYPEHVCNLTGETKLRYRLDRQYINDRIAIHLWTCEFDNDEFIQIYTEDGYINETWRCYDNRLYSQENEPFAGSYDNSTAIRVVDDISNPVWVEASFKSNSISHSQATIVVNIYKQVYDTTDKCGSGFFDCFRAYNNYCPNCCSNENDFFNLRCILKDLQCNGRPNCGLLFNDKEESYEACYYDEPLCPTCQSFCLSWNYIITSLAIAVLFIVTPTVIVFALFHRRNVALARARLERMAQERMADMRGEFTRDSPLTDLPPSYEEVYETKEPPPCFCQAVAMEIGSEVVQQRCEDGSGNEAVLDSSENLNNNSGIQNQAFYCSCSNIGTLSQEPLPCYVDMSGSGDQNVDEVDTVEVDV